MSGQAFDSGGPSLARASGALLAARVLGATGFFVAAVCAITLACEGARGPAPAPARAPAASASHGYALLYEILGQEAKVSQLLVIKSDREALGRVIEAIADVCGAAHERLEELAARPPRLDLEDTGLPQAELRTRERRDFAFPT